MKTITVLCVVSILTAIMVPSALAAKQAISAGARYHARHSEFTELPYNKGDMSYQIGYEYHEGGGFWQLLLGYTPSIRDGSDGRGSEFESVLTPQLNLLFEDRNWLAGAGVLASYIRTVDDSEIENDWTSIYWQVMLGLRLPLPVLNIEIMAYYPFEKWSTFRDFSGKDIEYGIIIKRLF